MIYHIRSGRCLNRCVSCSLKGNKYLLGRKQSEAHKKKISVAHLGKKKSAEHAKNIGLARKGVPMPQIAGENHYRWIKDRSSVKLGDRFLNDPLQKQWRKEVKSRDGWVCRIADVNCDGRLEAHHILPWSKFPELRYKVNNGITLCRFHHPRKMDDVMKLSPFFNELVTRV